MEKPDKDQDKDIEIMRGIIARKKQKSASQGSIKRGPEDRFSTAKSGHKKQKKAGLSPK